MLHVLLDAASFDGARLGVTRHRREEADLEEPRLRELEEGEPHEDKRPPPCLPWERETSKSAGRVETTAVQTWFALLAD